MEHVVFYPGPDAGPAFGRFSSLDEAVRFVEHLRNVEGLTEVSVHALTPVPLAFRAYYKAEVPAAEGLAEPVPAAPVVPVVDEVPEQPVPVAEPVPLPEQPMPEPVLAEAAPVEAAPSSNGKRTLGFFAH